MDQIKGIILIGGLRIQGFRIMNDGKLECRILKDWWTDTGTFESLYHYRASGPVRNGETNLVN